MKKNHTNRSRTPNPPTHKGKPLDPARYTELGRFIAERLERMDMRLADAVAKVHGIDPRDSALVKSYSGGRGSSVLRGIRSLSEEETDRWARVLKLEEGEERDRFFFLSDVQRLEVAAPYSQAAKRLRERIRYLEQKLADAKAAGRGLPPTGAEPEVL